MQNFARVGFELMHEIATGKKTDRKRHRLNVKREIASRAKSLGTAENLASTILKPEEWEPTACQQD